MRRRKRWGMRGIAKSETRISKSETNPKLECANPKLVEHPNCVERTSGNVAIRFRFRIWDFEFVSDFDIRISDLSFLQSKHLPQRFQERVPARFGRFLGESGNRAVQELVLQFAEGIFDLGAVVPAHGAAQIR